MTILVVDDDPHTRALHSHYLRKAGYRVLTAASAMDAFELLQLSQPTPVVQLDLILMDLMMPEVDGLEACRRIQASAAYSGVPIVFITASDPEESLLAAYNSGAVGFLTKPVKKEALLVRIGSLLKMKNDLLSRPRAEPEELKAGPREISLVDPLTGVSNRRHLDSALDEVWRRAEQKGLSVSLVVIDLDCLTLFRERLGQDAADELLKRVAQVLRRSVTRSADLLARYSAEEFAVLLPETESPEARNIARRLREAVRALAAEQKADNQPPISASFGVASVRPGADGSADGLSVLADGAVSCAQSAGRNQVVAVELVV